METATVARQAEDKASQIKHKSALESALPTEAEMGSAAGTPLYLQSAARAISPPGLIQRAPAAQEEEPSEQQEETAAVQEEEPIFAKLLSNHRGIIQRQAEEEEEEEETPEAAEEPEEEPELISTKLTIGAPDDKYEQEADRVAGRVMRMQQPASVASSQLQPLDEPITPMAGAKAKSPCEGCGDEEKLQRQPRLPTVPEAEEEEPEPAVEPEAEPGEQEEEGTPAGEEGAEKAKGGGKQDVVTMPEIEPAAQQEEMPDIQSKGGAGSNGTASKVQNQTALHNSLRQTKGGGSPMAPAVQSEMEGHFGKDLSQVRVHTDSNAVRMNRDIGARAFTHEKDIYFNAGEYPPDSPGGKQLLAHELTHTIQQGAVSDTVQRYAEPPQKVATEAKPPRPDDGTQVRGRVNEKINNDPKVQDQDDLDEDEREEAKNPNRGEVRQETSEIESTGEAKPTVDRGAPAQQKTGEQKAQIDQEVQEQPPEAEEEGAGEGEGAGAEMSEAEAAAQAAQAAEQQAQSVEIPSQPEPFRHPRIEAPVDSAGQPLPRNSQIDTQVRGLGYIGEMLRQKGYEMKRHAAEQEIGSHGQDAVIHRMREDLANAKEGTATMDAHNQARQEIAQQSSEAHTESVDRQQFVAQKAPELASKADEGQVDSGELASESQSKAERSQREIPDDPDAQADAEKQSGDMQRSAEGAASMDQAMRQTGERARQYEQEAAAAEEQNQQSEEQIAESEEVITQTSERIGQMHAQNEASQAQIENAGPGPALIRQHAAQTAQSGDQLIAATIVMEQELNALQDQYLADMAGIESREAATERIQREQEESQSADIPPEEAQLIELAGLSEEEQQQRVAEMDQTQRDGLLAALERMIQQAPDQGTDATEGARFKVDTGLSKAIMGDRPVDPRAQQIQEVENRRIQRVGGVLNVADQNMNFLTAEQQRMLANRLVAESISDSIKNINVLQMGKQMLAGMIDPRQSLASVVGGFEKMLGGFANIGNWEAWRRDPLGNLLQIAADITTGLAMIFSTILGIAGIITALMVALTILSWGFLSPVTGPVIAWMGTIMTYAGWGAIITGALAVYFNYLAYIKNLHDAGTAETARELFGNTEQMKQNATDGFQGAMAVVEGIGAVKMGPKLSSGEFFANVPRSPGAFASRTLQGAREGIGAIAGAPAALARGARRLFSGGKRGLIRFKKRVQNLFARRRGRPRGADIDINTPTTRRRHETHLNSARDKRVRDMDRAEFRSEMREVGNNRPRRVDPNGEHFKDYDVEIKANGHTYRRRRDGKGWCRFSAKECGIKDSDLPDTVNQKLKDDGILPEDLSNYKAGDRLPPKKTFNDRGYTYHTDDLGRVNKVEGQLRIKPKGRKRKSSATQTEVGKLGHQPETGGKYSRHRDEGGHLIGDRFEGSSNINNLVPQNANLNRGAWKRMENGWAKALEEGKNVKVRIDIEFDVDGIRPKKFNVVQEIDGIIDEFEFINRAGG